MLNYQRVDHILRQFKTNPVGILSTFGWSLENMARPIALMPTSPVSGVVNSASLRLPVKLGWEQKWVWVITVENL